MMNPRIMGAQEPPINIDKQASSPLEEFEDLVTTNKTKNDGVTRLQIVDTHTT